MFNSKNIITLFVLLLSTFFYSCTVKKKINIFYINSAKEFNHIYIKDGYNKNLAQQVFEPLYDYNNNSIEIEPVLAKVLPQKSIDDKTWIIPIRDDVKFSDNKCFKNGVARTVNTKDLIYSIIRAGIVPDSIASTYVMNISGMKEARDFLINKIDTFLLNKKIPGITVNEPDGLIKLEYSVPNILSTQDVKGISVDIDICNNSKIHSLIISDLFNVKKSNEATYMLSINKELLAKELSVRCLHYDQNIPLLTKATELAIKRHVAYSNVNNEFNTIIIKGMKDVNKEAQQIISEYLRSVSVLGLEDMGNNTLKIILKKGDKNFLYSMTETAFYATPVECVEYYKENLSNNPVGTGPYVLNKITNKEIEFVKNKNYTRWEKGLKPIDIILLKIVSDTYDGMWKLYRKGEIDNTIIGIESFSEFKSYSDSVKGWTKFAKTQMPITTFYAFNSSNNGVSRETRRYISSIINKESISSSFCNGNKDLVATSIVPPVIRGNRTYNINNKYSQITTTDKLEIYIHKSNYQIAKYIQTLLNSKSISLDIITFSDFNEFYNKRKTGEILFYLSARKAALPIPSDFYQLFYSKSPIEINFTKFINLEYDNIYEKVFMNYLDGTSLESINGMNRLDKIIEEEVPVIPIMYPSYITAYRSYVKGYKIHPYKLLVLKNLEIDEVEYRKARFSIFFDNIKTGAIDNFNKYYSATRHYLLKGILGVNYENF